MEELIQQTIPEEIRLPNSLDLPEGISEFKFLNELRELSEKNQLLTLTLDLVTIPQLLLLLFNEIFWKTQGGIPHTLPIRPK